MFRVTIKFSNELMQYLLSDLLSKENKLRGSHYAAQKTIQKLGFNYNNIHACLDGCVLYEDDHAELKNCPKCSKAR